MHIMPHRTTKCMEMRWARPAIGQTDCATLWWKTSPQVWAMGVPRGFIYDLVGQELPWQLHALQSKWIGLLWCSCWLWWLFCCSCAKELWRYLLVRRGRRSQPTAHPTIFTRAAMVLPSHVCIRGNNLEIYNLILEGHAWQSVTAPDQQLHWVNDLTKTHFPLTYQFQ